MQFSTQLIALPLPAFIYLILLTLGYGAIGWLLAAFQTALWIGLGTTGILFHLTCVGKDAIVLANGWTVGVFAIAAVVKAWTPAWGKDIPYTNAKLWAGTLILLWAGSVLLVFGSTLAQSALKTLGVTAHRIPFLLALLVLLTIGSGSLTYHLLSIAL